MDKFEPKDTGRLESFSDDIFAFAMTLLILDIQLPEVSANVPLLTGLAVNWTSFVAFLIGFFTLLTCWINHRFMFGMIHRSDSVLVLINGVKLLVVTATPFSTKLLSKYIQTEWQHGAVNLYCFNFALMGLAMTCIWSYANRNRYTVADSPAYLTSTTRLYCFAGAYSTAIWLISFWSIVVCLVLSVIMFVIFVAPQRAVAWQVSRRAA